MRLRVGTIAFGFALASMVAMPAFAQTAAPALPPGHPDTLPPGHPAVDAAPGAQAGTGMEQLPNFRQVPLPETFANEAPDLPAGVALVRVIDAAGTPLADVPVRMGSLREGERQEAVEQRTRWDGVAQFERLATGSNVAYRASVDSNGARFASGPFQLSTNAGYRVQLVRFDTDNDARSVLIADARVEIAFQDDRLVVVERANIVNFSNMSLSGQAPHPVAFVPNGGLRFALPEGHSAFRVDEQSMGDQHVTEEGNVAVLRGSIPPTGAQGSIPIVFQYRVKLSGSEATLNVTMPLPVLRATVVSQAPAGMHLEVAGMEAAEERTHDGQRILITGRERTSHTDAPIDHIEIRLSNIPSSAGPERIVALLLAIGIIFGSVVLGISNYERSGRRRKRSAAALEAERARLIDEAASLRGAHERGDLGPDTFDRRKRQVSLALASVLRELAEAAPAGRKT